MILDLDSTSTASVKEPERVVAVVHEVDASSAGSDGQPEERPAADTGVVDQLHVDLRSAARRLDHVPVTRVDGQDVSVRGDGEAERAVEGSARGDGASGTGAPESERRMGDRGDAVRKGVGHVERAVVTQPQARRPDHQRRGVGSLAEAGADHTGATTATGLPRSGTARTMRTTVPALTTSPSGRHRAVEHVADEQHAPRRPRRARSCPRGR